MPFSQKQRSLLERAIVGFRCGDALPKDVMEWIRRADIPDASDSNQLVGDILAITYAIGDDRIPSEIWQSAERFVHARLKYVPRIIRIYEKYNPNV